MSGRERDREERVARGAEGQGTMERPRSRRGLSGELSGLFSSVPKQELLTPASPDGGGDEPARPQTGLTQQLSGMFSDVSEGEALLRVFSISSLEHVVTAASPPVNPWLYLLAIFAAELLIAFVNVYTGLLAHCLLLLGMLFDFARAPEEVAGRRGLLTGLAFAPLIRILSLSLPLGQLPRLYWYLITGLPLFTAVLAAGRALRLTRAALGLNLNRWPLQLLVGLSGLPFGAAQFYILAPEPLAPRLAWSDIWWPALVLLVAAGLLEELIFRGLLQHTAVCTLGSWTVVYVTLIFAALHIGHRSLPDFVFVLGVGLFLGWVRQHTGSILGAILSHGLTNIVLFLVMPFIA